MIIVVSSYLGAAEDRIHSTCIEQDSVDAK